MLEDAKLYFMIKSDILFEIYLGLKWLTYFFHGELYMEHNSKSSSGKYKSVRTGES